MAKTKDGKELREEFEFWGWKWETCMENERPLHPNNPRYYIDCDNVITLANSNLCILSMEFKPTCINWWDSKWKTKIDYYPKYSAGCIKSIDTVQVNSIIEADLKFPAGENLWPSFWLTACDSWPPEIDIVEGYTDSKGSYKDGLNFHWHWPFIYREYRLESNVHYKGINEEHFQVGAKAVHPKVLNLPLEYNWNHFKCVWTSNSIRIYINDNLVREVTDESVLSRMKTKGMWVIFNIWPNDKYNLTTHKHFYLIKDFKVTKL